VDNFLRHIVMHMCQIWW